MLTMNNIEVQIGKITPKLTEQKLFTYDKCYVGISINNPLFYGYNLRSILEWINTHFTDCLIVIGDYLFRHNEKILSGKTDTDAIKSALLRGDTYVQELNDLLAEVGQQKFKIVRWKKLYNKESTQEAFVKLKNMYQCDSEFQKQVKDSATNFIFRKQKQGKNIPHQVDEAIELSCKYLLEEMSVFNTLVGLGWKVEVYPGEQIPILEKIIENKFPSSPENLQERVFVNLKLKELTT
jgi:tRNA-dependent cyclodipeptide synthase